ILDGIRDPATREIGFMPGFRDSLDDTQLAQLAAYMRKRFAPDKPAWEGLEAAASSVRAARGP
ncbi:MAG: cytochrome c, partial [Rhizobiales bacterium]|nr:cytochrome c [Rhizobacter sp.]